MKGQVKEGCLDYHALCKQLSTWGQKEKTTTHGSLPCLSPFCPLSSPLIPFSPLHISYYVRVLGH